MSVTAAIILVTAVYSAVCLWIGYLGWRRTRLTPVDYFLAGRSLGTFVLALTFIATYASLWTFYGAVGANYRLGPSFMSAMITWNLIWPLMIWVMGTRLWVLGQRFGCITPSDLFAEYYQSEAIRVLTSVVGIIALIPYMSIQLLGGGLAFEAATGKAIPFWVGALFMAAVMMVYTFVGGLRAVAWTDVLQGIFFLGVMLALSVWILGLPEGGNAFRASAAVNPKLFDPTNFGWGQWLGFVCTWGLSPLLPHLMQRCFMARSARVITRTAASLAILSPWVQTVPVMIVGVAAVSILPGLKGGDTDAVIPLLLAKYAPYVGAVVVAGAWAAGMSTLDSQLLSASSLVTRDLYRYVRPRADEKEEARVGQLFVAVVTVIMYLFVLTRPGFIVVLGTAGAGIAIAGYLFPAIGVLFWPRAGRVAALGGLLAGGLAAFLTFAAWRFPLGLHNTLWGLLVGAVVFLVLAYTTPPLPYAQQARFHGLLAEAIAGGRKAGGPEAATVPTR